MRYDFYCPVGQHYFEVRMPMNDYSGQFCVEHMSSANRVWTMPVISMPETSAVEVLNRHVRGEGDPLPGYTQVQTKWMANEKARIQKREKGQKSGGGPSQSFPGGGAVSRVHGD